MRKTKRNVSQKVQGNKGKRRSFNPKEMTEAKEITEATKPGNDPAWYASNPVILRDAASFPFSYNTGASEIHDLSLYTHTDLTKKPLEQIAGILSLHVHPVVGGAHYATDPINVAAQSVYSFVRHANSGHSNYDPADLMIYIMAMANMYSYLTWCQRLYGYALTYDQRNRYIPQDLIRTNNVDADDLRANLANFRFWINTLIAKMVSFAVPATMSIFSRMSFIYSDYYIEGTSIKDQLYQYVPEGFYKFQLDSSSLGSLHWEAFDYTTPMTVNDVMTYGNDLFDAIWSQEDFGIMSGDILKAYGANIIKLAPLPEYYSMVPKFDAMVLTQMKNADLFKGDFSDIAQDPNDGTVLQTIIPIGVVSGQTWYGTSATPSSGELTKLNAGFMSILKDYRILTVDTDDPTPDIVMEATRLKVVYNLAKAWFVAGTEIVTHMIITEAPNNDIRLDGVNMTFSNNDANCFNSNNAYMYAVEAASHFHYLPRFWFMHMSISDGKFGVHQHFDIDNFTLMTYEDVRKLHEAATVNMFAVPSIGKVQ